MSKFWGMKPSFPLNWVPDEWMAKWSGQWHIDIGDSIPLCLSIMAHFVLFDAETGELIKQPTDLGNFVFGKEVLL